MVHQVLDRAHAHFRGIPNPATRGTIPSEQDIEAYFGDVQDGLRLQGITASHTERDQALRVLKYFNQLEGSTLYPRVVDTEHRLQADNQQHVLFGVVDLLVDPVTGSTAPNALEIWDYKGQSRTTMSPQDRESYEFQMRVYAHLYERRHGVMPGRVLLYFVNELDGNAPPASRPVNAVMEVTIDPAEVLQAVQAFGQTVQDIEAARLANYWPPAQSGNISNQTCAACDLRWDCQTPNNGRGVTLRCP